MLSKTWFRFKKKLNCKKIISSNYDSFESLKLTLEYNLIYQMQYILQKNLSTNNETEMQLKYIFYKTISSKKLTLPLIINNKWQKWVRVVDLHLSTGKIRCPKWAIPYFFHY